MNEIYFSNVFSLFISSTQVNQKVSVFSGVTNLESDSNERGLQTVESPLNMNDIEAPQATTNPTPVRMGNVTSTSTGGY